MGFCVSYKNFLEGKIDLLVIALAYVHIPVVRITRLQDDGYTWTMSSKDLLFTGIHRCVSLWVCVCVCVCACVCVHVLCGVHVCVLLVPAAHRHIDCGFIELQCSCCCSMPCGQPIASQSN